MMTINDPEIAQYDALQKAIDKAVAKLPNAHPFLTAQALVTFAGMIIRKLPEGDHKNTVLELTQKTLTRAATMTDQEIMIGAMLHGVPEGTA